MNAWRVVVCPLLIYTERLQSMKTSNTHSLSTRQKCD